MKSGNPDAVCSTDGKRQRRTDRTRWRRSASSERQDKARRRKKTSSIKLKKYSFEIIHHVATLSTKENGETLELNLVEYSNAGTGVDLRRWRNGKPIRGMHLEREFLEDLYIFIQSGLEVWSEFPEIKIEAKNETPLKLSEKETENLYSVLLELKDILEFADDDEGGADDDEEAGDAETARNQ